MLRNPLVVLLLISCLMLLLLAVSLIRAGLSNVEVILRDRASGHLYKEKIPGAFWLQWLYHTAFGRASLELLVKHRFLSAWYGKKMDQPASVEKIQPFIDDLGIDMTESLRQVGSFTNFNDFFIRELKPGARPLAEHPLAVLSPGDGRLLAFNTLDTLESFYVKGHRFSLSELLGSDELAEKFQGGSAFFLRLAPADYHRFHFPVSGTASAPRLISGSYYSVSPLAVRQRIRIFLENVRHITLIRRDSGVQAAMLEIGATLVGSIVQTSLPESRVERGSEKGYFCFGGSSIILLFPEGSIVIDEDILQSTREGIETRVLMGEAIAVLNSGV